MGFEQELDLLARSSYPIIYIPTAEEGRAEQLIFEVATATAPQREVHVWDFVLGYEGGVARNNPVQALDEVGRAREDVPAFFVLRDFHRFLDDVQVSRTLRNLAQIGRASCRERVESAVGAGPVEEGR